MELQGHEFKRADLLQRAGVAGLAALAGTLVAEAEPLAADANEPIHIIIGGGGRSPGNSMTHVPKPAGSAKPVSCTLMPAAGGNSGVAGTVSAAVITQRKPKDTKTYCQEEFTKFFPGLPVLKVIQWYEFTTPKYSGADEGSAAHGTVTDDPNNPGSFLVTPISLPDTIVIVLLGS
jgi:hypothetical protein